MSDVSGTAKVGDVVAQAVRLLSLDDERVVHSVPPGPDGHWAASVPAGDYVAYPVWPAQSGIRPAAYGPLALGESVAPLLGDVPAGLWVAASRAQYRASDASVVAEIGQRVGRIDDPVTGWHATQDTGSLQPQLALDGGVLYWRADRDAMALAANSATRAVGAVTLFAVARRTAYDSNNQSVIAATTGTSASATRAGLHALGSERVWRLAGRRQDNDDPESVEAGDSGQMSVLVGTIDYENRTLSLRINGQEIAFDDDFQGGGLTSDTDSQYTGIFSLGTASSTTRLIGDVVVVGMVIGVLALPALTALERALAAYGAVPLAPAATVHRIDDTLNDADAVALLDVDSDGQMDVIAAEATGTGRAVYWYQQATPESWTRHTIDDAPGTEIEGVAAFHLRGDVYVVALDQAEGKIRLYTPATADPTGEWDRTELASGKAWLQDVVAWDIDGDGEPEIVYTYEGDEAGAGGVYWLDFDGADPMDPGGWQDRALAVHEGAWWIARARLDLAGHGRGDIVFSARNRTDRNVASIPGVYWLEQPEDVTGPWARHTIDDRNRDWLHVDVGEFHGDRMGRDIVAGSDQDLAVYRYADAFARTDLPRAKSGWAWNVRTIPAENGCRYGGRDAILVAHEQSHVYVYRWSQWGWIAHPVLAYPTQHHPLDDDIVWHDVDGDGVLEAFIADSSTSDSKLVWMKVGCNIA